MAKLLFLLDGNSLGEFALDKERITIGRRPSNQIHIDNLAVSGEHAVIVTIGNDSFLEDYNPVMGSQISIPPNPVSGLNASVYFSKKCTE